MPWGVRPWLLLVWALHFGLGAAMGLSVDEAHYLLYALHPALSYFDHPPLVGWLQWPWVALNLPTAALRLLPGVLWVATVGMAYRVAVRLHGEGAGGVQAGLWSVWVLALAPLLHVLGIGLLPDTLLMFFTAALMWQTLELMHAPALHRTAPWLLLGVTLGLAGLSKYTAILMAAAAGVCLLAAHGWGVLRNARLWLAATVALVLVAPVALWNAQNQWISFTYQARHGAGSAWQALHLFRFLLVQLLVYGPLFWWSVAGVRQLPQRGHRWLVGFFLVSFGVLAAMSGGGTSLPHWTAPAWVALAPFAGLGLARALRQGRSRWIAACVGGCVGLQALTSAALLGLMLSGGPPLVAATNADVPVGSNPFADLHGWDAAGQRARKLAAAQHLDRVAVQNWTLASRLGWYARPLPVHVLEDRFDQFDLWAGDLPAGASALLVDWSHMAYALPLGAHGFARCDLVDTLEATRWGWPMASFRFYACHGWSGQPQPRLKLADTP